MTKGAGLDYGAADGQIRSNDCLSVVLSVSWLSPDIPTGSR